MFPLCPRINGMQRDALRPHLIPEIAAPDGA
jgi:hypothetical protein